MVQPSAVLKCTSFAPAPRAPPEAARLAVGEHPVAGAVRMAAANSGARQVARLNLPGMAISSRKEPKVRIYDLSVILRPGMPVWPGETGPSRELRVSTAKGDICNVSQLAFGAHTGTHVDAPFHFIPDGKTLEQVAVERLVGPVRVVEIEGEGDIDAATLDALAASGAIPPGTQRLLFKTRNTARGLLQEAEFRKDYVAVA